MVQALDVEIRLSGGIGVEGKARAGANEGAYVCM
jgi:hypothetical protein